MGGSEPRTRIRLPRIRAGARWRARALWATTLFLANATTAAADLTRVELLEAPCSGKVQWMWTGGDATDVWESAHWEYAVTITADGRYRLSALHQGRCHEAAPRDAPLADAAHLPSDGLNALPPAGSGLVPLGTRSAVHPTELEPHVDRHVFVAERDAAGATRLTIFSSHGTETEAKAPGLAPGALAALALALGACAVARYRTSATRDSSVRASNRRRKR